MEAVSEGLESRAKRLHRCGREGERRERDRRGGGWEVGEREIGRGRGRRGEGGCGTVIHERLLPMISQVISTS